MTLSDALSDRASARDTDGLWPAEAVRATTILVVAAHALIREGLRSILHETPGLSVVAEADDLGGALPIARRFEPDVVLLAARPSDSAERSAISLLRRERPATCLLCLASDGARSMGDLLCLPPNAGVDELCSVLGSALGGRCAGCLLKPKCVAPQIAATLGIALRTVNTYREGLAKKVGASSGAVLTRFVLEARLDTPGPLGHLL